MLTTHKSETPNNALHSDAPRSLRSLGAGERGRSADEITVPPVFISYRRQDCSFIAAVVCERLERRFGADSVFLDVDDIPLAVDFRAFILEALQGCKLMVVFIGERWVVDGDGQRRFDDPDDCVCWEIESARERKIPVLPVLAGISSMPSEAVLPASVRFICRQQAAEIQGGRHFFADLERLEGGIARLLGYYEKPIVIGQFGVGAPDHVVVLGTLGDRFQKVPERRSVQKTMLVQAAAGGDAILSWSTQGNVEDWRTDPFGAIGLLRDLTSAPSSVGDFEDSRRTMMHACEHVSRPTA